MTRRQVLGVLAAPVGTVIVGCGADHPGYALGYSTGRGRAAASGHLELRNIVGVSAQAGSGTLLATIFNEGALDDALLKVALRGGTSNLSPAQVQIPARDIAVIGADTSLAGDPAAVSLTGPTVRAGCVVHLTFRFQRAAPLVDVSVLVQERSGPYTDVSLTLVRR